MMRFASRIPTLFLLAVACWTLGGRCVARAGTERLALEPSEIVLHDAAESSQLLATLELADGARKDVTHAAPSIDESRGWRVEHGRVVPTGNGKARIEVVAGDRTASVSVEVRDFDVERRLNFTNDIEPVLTKFGCNAGGCHGKASGQNGFKLSLLGFDPAGDYDALVKEGRGRRIFPAAPERSLLLTKPTGQSPHGGGRKFDHQSPAYSLLLRWLDQGAPLRQER